MKINAMKQMLLAAVLLGAGIAGILLYARRKDTGTPALDGNNNGGLLAEEIAGRRQYTMG
jgi:hypothetical protein